LSAHPNDSVRSFTPSELALNTAYIARHYAAFARRPFAERERTRSYQLHKLQRLVRHAYDRVGLYREKYRAAGITPDDLRSLDDFVHFPSVTKADVLAAYPEGALERGLDLDRCLVSKSSGSTGHVLDVVHRADRVGIQGLAMNRLLSLYGAYLPWHRFVYVYTSEYPARSLLGLYPMTLIPTLAPTQEILRRLHELRPHLLACYPSHLRALANELGPAGCRRLSLRAISVSSELSTQRERDELAALFGCGVYDEYSTEELTRVAAQCRERTYHLFEDVAYVEILAPDSDRPCGPGERGEVTGTYLHNLAMPFIRYRQGDLATIDDTPCRCGRTFRALANIGGRKLDQFVLPSGKVLTSGFLLDASYSFLFDVGADIAAFTMVQEAVDRIRIDIVPGRGWNDVMAAAIVSRFRDLAAEPLDVRVETLAEVRRSGAGKHHPIISFVGRGRGQ